MIPASLRCPASVEEVVAADMVAGVVDEAVVEVGSADTNSLMQYHCELTGLKPTRTINPWAGADGKRLPFMSEAAMSIST